MIFFLYATVFFAEIAMGLPFRFTFTVPGRLHYIIYLSVYIWYPCALGTLSP